MTSTQPLQDPSLAHAAAVAASTHAAAAASQSGAGAPGEVPSSGIPLALPQGLPQDQVLALLKHLPSFMNRGDLKDSVAAETLSNLSQAATFAQHQGHPQSIPHPHQYHTLPPHLQHPHGPPSEPGPSSHPRGPPNLGQLSAVATALQGAPQQPPPTSAIRTGSHAGEGAPDGDGPGGPNSAGGEGSIDGADKSQTPSKSAGGRRGGRNPTMSNDEWARQRKDNHKEVERRRRGNINEGINELGRIVPNGSGEKAKGAILSRAVQYIHHLKENEARNIEKWTLEKLLMDQAMGDLQAQLEEMRRMWEEERVGRQRLETELQVLRGMQTDQPVGAASAADEQLTSASDGPRENGKREREEESQPENAQADGEQPAEGDDRAKRPRME
ncbi:hypothetical protein OBBRIDRAFT_793586 [Obba rivulosa]|uniref:BHLH domain-containing protein n=1 Tax=Obba rivulosa TaxID=1052685 RepID=A0A8E2AVU4_9APHY|nr:hypothetical protein OBBRIDRAFT_793586 [Obba rivulosa]